MDFPTSFPSPRVGTERAPLLQTSTQRVSGLETRADRGPAGENVEPFFNVAKDFRTAVAKRSSMWAALLRTGLGDM